MSLIKILSSLTETEHSELISDIVDVLQCLNAELSLVEVDSSEWFRLIDFGIALFGSGVLSLFFFFIFRDLGLVIGVIRNCVYYVIA